MKVLRDTEWKFAGRTDFIEVIDGPAFIFQNLKYGDIIALKVAKYIDTTADVVYYFDADRNYVGASNVEGALDYSSSPALRKIAK